ncbi:MAG: hypothetical protein ABIX12_13125 [Rubrivivax sp.]
MLIHPLVKTLVARPELLAEHAGAYAELASAEIGQTARRLRTRTLLIAAMALCIALGALFAGGALLLLAAVPIADMPAPWALAAVPGGIWLAAGVLWWAQSRDESKGSFEALRAQFALDRELLRAAGEQ